MGIADGADTRGYQIDDHDLFSRLSNDDEVALNALMARHQSTLIRAVTHVLHDPDVAEEIVCHLWERIWETRRRELPTDPDRFLCRSARNLALDWARSERTRRSREGRWQSEGLTEPMPCDANIESSELLGQLIDEILALPARRRDAFLLVAFWGLSHANAASKLGLSDKTIENHVSAAKRTLRSKLRHVLNGHHG
jgi:RNA polymerase sigma factor (sigma-70 family)